MSTCDLPQNDFVHAAHQLSPCVSSSLWPQAHDRQSCCELTSHCTSKIFFFLHVHKAGGTSLCKMASAAGLVVPPISPPFDNCISPDISGTWMTVGRQLRGCRVPGAQSLFCAIAHETLRRQNVTFFAWEPHPLPTFDPGVMLCTQYFRYGVTRLLASRTCTHRTRDPAISVA